jgi:DNA-binding HxlR family transcriptional regulator
LKYDANIDHAIITGLERESMYWTELYVYVCSIYRRISYDAFTKHLGKLMSDKLVDRNYVMGRGKKVPYFLTEKAKQQQRLQILEFRSPKERAKLDMKIKKEKRQTLYILLLLFRPRSSYQFETKQEFENFLSAFDLSRKDLITIANSGNVAKVKDEYYMHTELKSSTGDITISIRKYTKSSNRAVPSNSYLCSVKGLTAREILNIENRPAFWHIDFTTSEVEAAFKSLY